MTTCLLVAQQRSGTGALGTVLDQHKDCKYFGEIFHNDAVDKYPNFFHFMTSKLSVDNLHLQGDPEKKFDLYIEHLRENETKNNFILDIKYNSLHHLHGFWQSINSEPRILNIARMRRLPIIHLARNNKLRMYISGKLAEKNKTWHARKEDRLSQNSLKINVEEAIRAINRLCEESRYMERLLENYDSVLHLEYVDLFDESNALNPVIEKPICSILKIPPFEKRTPAFVKQTHSDLSEVIKNYDQFAEKLWKTKHAWMLNSN